MTFKEWYDGIPKVRPYDDLELERLTWYAATLAERERCAKIAEDWPEFGDEAATKAMSPHMVFPSCDVALDAATRLIAAAIRAGQ